MWLSISKELLHNYAKDLYHSHAISIINGNRCIKIESRKAASVVVDNGRKIDHRQPLPISLN